MEFNVNNVSYEDENLINKKYSWGKLTKKTSIFLMIFYFAIYQLIISAIPIILYKSFLITSLELIDLINLAINITVVFIILFLSRKVFKNDFKLFKENFFTIFIEAFKYYFFIFIGNYTINYFLSLLGSQSTNQVTIEELLFHMPISYIFLGVVFAPIVEEIIFRAIIFRNMYEKNKIIAYVLSSFIFGLLHVIVSLLEGNLINFMYILTYVNIGLLLTRFYDKHKTIYAPILLHFINNGIAISTFFLIKSFL